MEIVVGKTAGFCYGVKRAIEGAEEELKKNINIYCLGEIVHNKQVIENLKQKGMIQIENIEDSNGKTIIRAHGIAKEVYEKANIKNIEVKDLTCPKVLKIHEIANKFQKKGFFIFLFGSKTHPENIGTISYCGNNYYIINNLEEIEKGIEKLKEKNINKLAIISQTTFSLEKFNKGIDIIRELLKETNIEIEIKNTICNATETRQKETDEISKNVDLMIIIGGKNSSNTQKLFEIAQKNCKHSICIETKDELDEDKIKEYNKIGIMAGASTPNESIIDVIEKIKK